MNGLSNILSAMCIIIAVAMFAFVLIRASRETDDMTFNLDAMRKVPAELEAVECHADWHDIIDRVQDFANEFRGIDPNTLPAELCETVELARQILIDAHVDEDQVLAGAIY